MAATGTVTGSNIASGQIATGAGTTNTVPKYTNGASAVIGNSSITDNGTTVSTSEPVSLGSTLGVTGATTLSSTLGVTGATTLAAVTNTSEGTPKLNRVVWLDGAINTSLAQCLSAAATAKSVCEVPPNYSETVAADITVTNDTGLHFTGAAAINLGTHQFKCTGGTCNDFFIDSDIPWGSNGSPSAGVVFTYTGTTTPFSFGDTITSTTSISLRNIAINVSGGSAAVSAITLNRVHPFTIQNVRLIGTTGQIGINMIGTGEYTGNGDIQNFSANGFTSCIKMTANGNFNRIFASCPNTASGGKAIDITDGNGNEILVDGEVATVGINFGNSANVFGNRVRIYGQGNGTDAVFGAASVANTVDNIGANCGGIVPTVSDSGTHNSFWNPCKYQMDVNGNLTIASLKFVGTAPTCSFTSGGGTSPNCVINTGGTNNAGGLALLVGSGSPAASGTATLTFAGSFGVNLPNCTFTLSNRAGSNWNARATIIESSVSTSTLVFTWDNNAVALTASGNYQLHYNCSAD